jgi:UTP--glucose-1-phosphate uridylyltransferase
MPPQKIRKAVFPAAGMGTRFLPATKAMPKEMLCLVDKPLIQYGVEEAVAAGCTEIIITTGRGKSTMEDHFDSSPELEAALLAKNKTALLELVHSVNRIARVTYTRQPEPLGLGHAVLMAKELVGDEPFAVLLPDDIVDATVPCMKPSTKPNPASSAPRSSKALPSPPTASSTAFPTPKTHASSP